MSKCTATLFCFGTLLVVGCQNRSSDRGESAQITEHVPQAALTAELPRRTVPYAWSSGVMSGSGATVALMAAQETISVPGASWLQLQFGNVVLGFQSYIEVTSARDGKTQRLDAQAFQRWRGRSAYFNGDMVQIRVFVGPKDSGVSVAVKAVVAGEPAPVPESICGIDNRVASTEPRVARIDPIGCTAWIIDNGRLLTAGHCLAGSGNQTISFNPPQSLPDGTVQFPGSEDQYNVNQNSFDFANGGIGNDWGVFEVFDNSQTGVQPIAVQGSFAIRQDLGPANIRITGFGVDDGVTNQTNQTHVGPNAGSSGTTMRYTADTTGGNSGSPVIDEATGEAVGIHTHGGCTSSGGNNSGTSFFNSALFDAIGGSTTPPLECPPGSIDFNTLSLTSYADQNASNNTAVQDNGNVLRLGGNTWVRSVQTFNITPNTVLDFQFASSGQAEIHAIGFDENDNLNDAPRHFQFWGTQNWTGGGKIALTPAYSGNGQYQSYSVPVGENYTGTMNIVFTNDNDSGSSGEGRFGCVQIREVAGGSTCSVTEDFESGAGGWTNSGDCTTGAFTTGTPDLVNNGGVTTQPGGAQSGASALFTQPNTGGAGSDDVDGGECIATSPVYNVSENSDVSIHYFHGQRDQGDDANDGFALEISFNGGAFQSLVSIGDVTTNAAWTQATRAASAGDTVQLRVRATDGTAGGDLIEAGVDNLTICAP